MKMSPAQKEALIAQFKSLLNTEEDVRVSMFRQPTLTTKPEDAVDSYEGGKTLIVLVTRGPVSPLETAVTKLLNEGTNGFAQ